MFEYIDLITKEGWVLIQEIVPLALLGFLALVLFRRNWRAKAASVLPDSWLNVQYIFWNLLLVLPLAAQLVGWLHSEIAMLPGMISFWLQVESWGFGWALLATLLLVDFVDYWRHRISHMRWLWPIHAIHHSDRALTFLSTRRQHPLNILLSSFCLGVSLALLGVPYSVLATAYIFRAYHTYYIHADIPISYGKVLDHIFISPLHHRWHHHLDPKKANSNFAGLFAFYDWIFGSLHLPQKKTIPFGYDHPDYPKYQYLGQLLYPWVAWRKMIGRRWRAWRKRQCL